jgi:hypothetical protein
MCNIEQGWPLTYFQVAISFLLFGVGIPSLVLQTIVSEDLRGIVRRHSRFLKWGYASIVLVMLIMLVFAGIVVHCYPKNSSFITNITSMLSVQQWANEIIALTTVGLVGGWSLRYRIDSLLNNLKGKCERRIRRDGIPDKQVLDDICYLGDYGKVRGYKIRILEILEKLAYKIQAHKCYRGNGLEDIIQAIELATQKDIDVTNFTQGVLTLKHILEHGLKSETDSSSDTGAILRALQRLGAIAITMDNERPVRKILETVEFVSRSPNGAFSEAALALFELGAAALKHEHFLIAVETLSKLEGMICRKEPVDTEHSIAYLGLVAHFWAMEGSARQRALSSLKGIKFSPSRPKCLKSAQEFFFMTTRFTTADLLSGMISTS